VAYERKKILAGDVGGTKTDLGLFSVEGSRLKPIIEKRFINKDYKGPVEVIKEFLGSMSAEEITAASFGVAALIEGNKADLTNISCINDLAAMGWGLPLLCLEDLVVLQKGRPCKGNTVVIAAGTGLGEAVVFWDGTTCIPSATEGGHTDFAPREHIEIGLLEFLIKRYGHVSYERVLSGTGLKNIYDFLKESKGLEESPRIRERFEKEDPASVISDEAQKGGDETCRQALELFISIYGAEAGNLALKAMAVGGIYVGGGIAPKIIEQLKKGGFMGALIDKGRFKEFLSNIPVYVILNPRTALLGAAHHAARSISKMEYTLV
jgi:glucokinase